MKKLTAILLIILFIFNLGGYRLWFYFEQERSDKRMEAIIDKDEYNQDQLLTIVAPLSLPYQTDWKEYERVSGEINIDGKIYKYVKRKIQNGELILLCIPDYDKMQLETAKSDFFNFTTDLQNNPSKKSDNSKSGSFKNIISEYDDPNSFSFRMNQLNDVSSNFGSYQIERLLSSPHISPEQPPDTFTV